MSVDLRDYETGDRVTVVLEDGEEFTGVVTDRDYDEADDYSRGYYSAAFEGDWWDRVNDRVESEVLRLRQDYARRSGRPLDATLYGHVWRGEVREASEPEYKELGPIASASPAE